MQLITAPEPLIIQHSSIFLAGSIEQGKAMPWQDKIVQELTNFPCTLLNPRRKEWDASWIQSIDNPMFKEQVDWELTALEKAAIIVVYFDPATKAPITLLELGLYAQSGKLLVCCPNGYWRKGNVDIVCQRYGIPQLANLDTLIEKLKTHLQNNPT